MSTSTFPRFEGDSVTPFMANLASALALKGVEVDVLTPHAPGSRTVEDFAQGVVVHRFHYAWPESAEDICYGAGALENIKGHPFRLAKLPQLVTAQAAATLRLVRQRNHHVVHAHWLLPQGLTSLTASLLGKPVVVTAHGSDVLGLNGILSSWCKRQVVRHACALTANSDVTAKALQYLGAVPGQVEIIRIGAAVNGPDIQAGRNSLPDVKRSPMILFVGRLIELKGADDAINALQILRRRLPEASLVIVGDGPLRTMLESVAVSAGVGDFVRFAGWQQPEEVRLWMTQADILLMPSRRATDGSQEAQGVVPIEAMLSSLPVIATRSGGLSEIVRHEDTGLLVAERSPIELADAVSRLWSDAELKIRLINSAKIWAESEATMERTAEQFIRLYEHVLKKRTRK